jgi:uroporphyrinogen-III synthase
MSTVPPAPLRCALVTRPAAQAAPWCERLEALGVPARALPLIGIAPAGDGGALQRWFAGLHGTAASPAASLVMFVSPNAAQCLVDALPTGWQWPVGALAGATGPGTAAVLRHAGVPAEAIVAPAADAAQFDSEALWRLLEHRGPWAGRRAAIVRGDGGRDWLADTLRAAGAEVEFVQAYARRAPEWGEPERALLAQALADPERYAWLLSSSEALDHLAALAPGADWSAALALASHPRIAERARALGFGRVLPVRPAADEVAAVLKRLAAG